MHTSTTICKLELHGETTAGERPGDQGSTLGVAQTAEWWMSAQVAEQLEVARRRLRRKAVAGVVATAVVEPVPRIALTQQEACASLGCSEEFFVEHVRPQLRVVRRGRKRLFPVDELRRAIDAMAEHVI